MSKVARGTLAYVVGTGLRLFLSDLLRVRPQDRGQIFLGGRRLLPSVSLYLEIDRTTAPDRAHDPSAVAHW